MHRLGRCAGLERAAGSRARVRRAALVPLSHALLVGPAASGLLRGGSVHQSSDQLMVTRNTLARSMQLMRYLPPSRRPPRSPAIFRNSRSCTPSSSRHAPLADSSKSRWAAAAPCRSRTGRGATRCAACCSSGLGPAAPQEPLGAAAAAAAAEGNGQRMGAEGFGHGSPSRAAPDTDMPERTSRRGPCATIPHARPPAAEPPFPPPAPARPHPPPPRAPPALLWWALVRWAALLQAHRHWMELGWRRAAQGTSSRRPLGRRERCRGRSSHFAALRRRL